MSGGPTLAVVDGGKSGLRLVLSRSGERRYGAAAGFSYQPGQDDVDVMVAAVRAAAADLTESDRFCADRVCAGFTGLPGDRGQRHRLRGELRQLFGAEYVIVSDDAPLAHAGALAGPGVVVCAGTGSTVLAVGPDGQHAGLDAWGPLIGDRGSGWDVGLAGLRAAAAALDGVGPATSLTDRMSVSLNGTNLAALQALYRSADRTDRVASFAVQVAAAAREGDAVARQIWADAGAALAATAIAAAARTGLRGDAARVSWAGRLFAAGDLLLEPMRAALGRAGLPLVEPLGGPLDGGLLLVAATDDSPYRWLFEGSGGDSR
jgi:glucosamine kinase